VDGEWWIVNCGAYVFTIHNLPSTSSTLLSAHEKARSHSENGLLGLMRQLCAQSARIFFVPATTPSTAFLSSLPLAKAWLTSTTPSTHIMTVTSASFESLY